MFALTQSEAACRHCGRPVPSGVAYCCQGCESVHDLLIAKGLAHFYTLREQLSFQPPAPVAYSPEAASWPELNGISRNKFYLTGIHCLGCLWLLEKLPQLDHGIKQANLDLTHQILDLEIALGKTNWQKVAQLISQLGYNAQPLTPENHAHAKDADLQQQLLRIGTAGFCAGNIMLLSVSIYGGTNAWWGLRFGWLSLLLAIPALTYSAWPLYRAALLPLRHGKISVDLAIVLALLSGFSLSFWSLLQGSEHQIYFDSLTTLVFLLLSSRFMLSRIREKLSGDSTLLSFLAKERYTRLAPKVDSVSAEGLSPGDSFELREGQVLPVDAMLRNSEARFDLSLLTGESLPVKFLQGDSLDAGVKLLSPRVELKALRSPEESRLAKILEQIRLFQLNRSPTVEFADRLGRYFVFAALSIALALIFFLPGEEGIRRALALVIVTCPCVLAFAVPLAFTRAMQIAAGRGILFLAPEKIEVLAKANKFYFDKTGTLSTGQFELQEWRQLEGSEPKAKIAALALESHSSHPVAKAIVRALSGKYPLEASADFSEKMGLGVSGTVNGRAWHLAKAETASQAGNMLELQCDGKNIATLLLGDSLRAESASVVAALKKLGIFVAILSGDRKESVAATAKQLGIESWSYGLSPEQKAGLVSGSGENVMIGDGANDAIAFRGAAVGIAMQGSMEISLRNSDIVLTQPGLKGVLQAFELARATMRIVRRNFAITLIYNALAGGLAVSGLMEPLWAALLMPLSALSVFALTFWQLRRVEE